MTRTLPTDFITEKQKLRQTAPWIWLFECRVDSANAIRAAKYTTNVTWPAVTGDTFHAYPITFSSLAHATDARIRTTTLTVPNANRALTQYLEENNGLRDKDVYIRLSHSSHLDETNVPEFQFTVTDCNLDRNQIAFVLGSINAATLRIPYQKIDANHCRHQYGRIGFGCPYLTGAPGALQYCAKTRAECIKHGNDQEANNQERTLARMFGGFHRMPLPVN